MKANELMIGDWVKTNDLYKAIKDVKVRAISQYSVQDETTSQWIECQYIQPIPLTVEILEKNGWKWNQYNTSLELVVGTIHVGWGFYPNCISVSDWAENGDCQITSLRCEFVHKLQHILKDCYIDKKIEI